MIKKLKLMNKNLDIHYKSKKKKNVNGKIKVLKLQGFHMLLGA
jgi:hypothetical protein